MKVLFVASGNKSCKLGNVVNNQMVSLKNYVDIDFYLIKNRGFWGYLKNVSPLSRYLKQKEFDVIHSHYGLCGIVSLLASIGRRQKIIISFMGDDLIGIVGENGRYTFTSRIFVKFNFILAKYFYEYNIVKSPNLLYRLNGIKNVEIIPNGVDLDKFYQLDKSEAKKELNLHENKKYVVFISNPKRPEKNFKLAQESINLVKENINLISLYNIPNKELVLYYNATDCIILTSHHEGSPNVIKEAMACSCPIVSTNVGDVEWVIGSTEGCYIADFDPKDFAEKIKLALKFSESKGRTNGRERIIKLGLDSVSTAKKITAVYNHV